MEPTDSYNNYNLQNDENNEIKRYLSLFLSNWYWFAISLFISISIVYGINRYSSKLYVVSSALMIKDDQSASGSRIVGSVIPGGDIFRSQQNMKNEISILKSYNLNKRVIDSLPEFKITYVAVGKRNIAEKQLYKDCPFKVISESVDNQNRKVRINVRINSPSTYMLSFNGNKKNEEPHNFGQQISSNNFKFIIDLRDRKNCRFNPDESNKYYFYFTNSEELANNYRNGLNIYPIDKDATIVTLSKEGPVPQQEADYLNKLMEIYRRQGVEAKNSTADNTLEFINIQLGITLDSLKKVELKLQSIKRENMVLDLSKDGSLLQSRLEKFENESVTLEVQRLYYQYVNKYLLSKNETEDIIAPNIMGVVDPTLEKLIQELSGLQKQRKELSLNLEKDLPPVNDLTNNIYKIKTTLLENIVSSIENTKIQIDSVNKKLEAVNLEIMKLPAAESSKLNAQRDFDIDNKVYSYLLEKRAETGIARASNVSDNEVIDYANINNAAQIYPKPRANNIKAVLFGLLVPGIIMFLLYYLNNKIIDNSDIIRKTSVPIIGYISHSKDVKEIPVTENPKSSIAESFRSIRTSLRYFTKEANNSVIAITSTISSEGKTFISINLAAITAMLGKKVLLIGLDLRRPRIHKILGIDNSEGLTNYLIGSCEFEQVIKETTIENLYYATSGPIPPNPAELIETERMAEFINRARKEFDYIMIDTPPVAIVADTLLIARHTDINLFIVRQRFTSKNTLELIQELYREDKIKHMAIIINDISLTGYYGYGIRYGYYKGYGYSYGKNYYGQYSYGRYGYSDKEHGYYGS
jgi:tyrosine-protein kinase Etk/Wzc